MDLPITSGFAALAVAGFLWLSVNAMRTRRRVKVTVGTAGNTELERAVGAQGNAAEYIPPMLALVLLMELQGMIVLVVVLLAAVFVLGRVSHAYGLLLAEPKRKDFAWRVRGMAMTWGSLGTAASVVLLQGIGVL
jgi:uncharacterized protein